MICPIDRRAGSAPAVADKNRRSRHPLASEVRWRLPERGHPSHDTPRASDESAAGAFIVEIAGTLIEETFAEAFGMRYVRLIVTAHDEHWLDAAQRAVAGYASSIIACDAEIGLEQPLAADATPDGRPGIALLAFGFSADCARQGDRQSDRPVLDDLPHHGSL